MKQQKENIALATVKALRSGTSNSKGSSSNMASKPRTMLFSRPLHGDAHATRHAKDMQHAGNVETTPVFFFLPIS